jgi:hypothetical protein
MGLKPFLVTEHTPFNTVTVRRHTNSTLNRIVLYGVLIAKKLFIFSEITSAGLQD